MAPRELLKWEHFKNRQFAKLEIGEGLRSQGCVSAFTNTCYYPDKDGAFSVVGSPEECKKKCTDARCHAVMYYKNNNQCLTVSSDPFVSAENDWVPIPRFVTSDHEGSDIYAKIADESKLNAEELEALEKSKVGAVGNVVHVVYKDRENVTSEYCYRVIKSNIQGHNKLAYPIHVSGILRPNHDLHFKPFLYLENHYITAVRRWVVEMQDTSGNGDTHEMGLGCDIQGPDGRIAYPAFTMPVAEPIVSFPALPVDPVFSCGIPNDDRDKQRTEREHIMVIGDSITSSLWNTQNRCSMNSAMLEGRCTLHAHLQELNREAKVSAFGYPGMTLLEGSQMSVTSPNNNISLKYVLDSNHSTWDAYKQGFSAVSNYDGKYAAAQAAYTGQRQCAELPVDSLHNAALQYGSNKSFLAYVNEYSKDHPVDHLYIMLGTNDIGRARNTYNIDITTATDSLHTIIRNVTRQGQQQVYIVTPPQAWLNELSPERALYEELDGALLKYATTSGYNFVEPEHAKISYYADPVGSILGDGVHPDAQGLYSIAETFTAAKSKNSWNGRRSSNSLSLPADPAPVQRTPPTATLPAITGVQGPVRTLPNVAHSTLPSEPTLHPVDGNRAPRSNLLTSSATTGATPAAPFGTTTGATSAAPLGTTTGAAQRTNEHEMTISGQWSQQQEETPTTLLIIFGVLAGFRVLGCVFCAGLREKRQLFRQRTQHLTY